MNHDEHESTTAYAVGNVGSYSYEFLQNYTSEESLQYTYTLESCMRVKHIEESTILAVRTAT